MLEAFGDAILNRVHLSIGFPGLTAKTRSQIWINLLERNTSFGNFTLDDSWTPEIYSALGEFDINGRSIKNLLRI